MRFVISGADMARPSKTGGKTGAAKARKPSPAKGRKTTKTKHRIAAAPTPAKRHSASSPSQDLKAAREQQAATAEILKIIASSPSDVQPVFEAIAGSAKRLIGGFSAVVFRFIDGIAHVAAFTPTNPDADQLLKATFPRPVAEFPPFARAHAGGITQVPDTEAEPDERMQQLARARGFRSVLNAPLMSEQVPLGLITVTRKNAGSFSGNHVQLMQTFADQAVIAIENARLFEAEQARTR